jgi:hypothetical protein
MRMWEIGSVPRVRKVGREGVGGDIRQLILVPGCGWYAPLLTRSLNTQLAFCGAAWCYWSAVGCGGSGWLVVEVGWRRCDGRATCGRSRLTALLLGRLLGVLLCTEARSMGRAVQWSPMKPEGWSGRFPLKSSPTRSCLWLRYGLRNVPREHVNCAAGDVRVNRSWTSSWLTRLPPILLLVSWGELNIETARNISCAITIVG